MKYGCSMRMVSVDAVWIQYAYGAYGECGCSMRMVSVDAVWIHYAYGACVAFTHH
jgi:hypothetical protein